MTLGVTPEELPTVLRLARRMGLESLVDPESFVRETMVLPCQDPGTGIRVDFIFSFSPYERQAMNRVRSVEIGATPVRFSSPEDVIVHQSVAARPRDLEDVKSVLLKQPGLDLAYIRHWPGAFAETIGKPLLKQFEDVLQDGRLP